MKIAIIMIAARIVTSAIYVEHIKGKAKEWCPDYGGEGRMVNVL